MKAAVYWCSGSILVFLYFSFNLSSDDMLLESGDCVKVVAKPEKTSISDFRLSINMKRRWIYLDSLTVGVTEDSTVSRMTISLTNDDKTLEQIKKQLSRSVEVIWLVDYIDTPIHMKEILFVRINGCSDVDITELFRISKVFGITVIDYDGAAVLLKCTQTENKNNDFIALLGRKFTNRIEIVRGGSVVVEVISMSQR